jgi:16S rRNA (guanine1207-N2)-methyltransferase
LALDAVTLPGDGRIAVLQPAQDADLSALPPARVLVVSPMATVCAGFAARGYEVLPSLPGDMRFSASIVCLTRARIEAQALIAAAMAQTDGLVIVDGQKTDGADSMLRTMRGRTSVSAPVSKAHGKIYWAQGGAGLRRGFFPPMVSIRRRSCWPKPCPRRWGGPSPIWGPGGAIWRRTS